MFSQLFTLATLAILAVATPMPNEAPAACDTAPLQCCESVESAGSTAIAPILASLGITVQDVNALVGLTCSPVTVIGVGGAGSCDANAVCCEDNSHGGLAAIGCVPVSL